jgi:hypothetical protein
LLVSCQLIKDFKNCKEWSDQGEEKVLGKSWSPLFEHSMPGELRDPSYHVDYFDRSQQVTFEE